MTIAPYSSCYPTRSSYSHRPDRNLSTEISGKSFENYDFTRQLTPTQISSILSRIRHIFIRNREKALRLIENPTEIPNEQHFDQQAIQNLSTVALAEFLQGRLNEGTLASCCMLYQACDQLIFNRELVSTYHSSKGYSCFTISPLPMHGEMQHVDFIEAFDICDEQNEEKINYMLKETLLLTDRGVEDLKHALKNRAPMERALFTFKLPLGDVMSWSPFYHVLNRVMTGFHPISMIENSEINPNYPEPKVFVLPSFSILREMFNMHYGEDCITLRPVLGKCTTKTIEDYKRNDERIINLGTPGAEVPKKADGHYAGSLIFSMHDLYHAHRWSCVKKTERVALMHINDILAEALKKVPDDQSLKKLKWKLLDGELHHSSLGEKFGTVFQIEGLWEERHKRLVLENMVVNKEKWRQEFGLSIDDLLDPEQKEYQKIEVSRALQEVTNLFDSLDQHSVNIFNQLLADHFKA